MVRIKMQRSKTSMIFERCFFLCFLSDSISATVSLSGTEALWTKAEMWRERENFYLKERRINLGQSPAPARVAWLLLSGGIKCFS